MPPGSGDDLDVHVDAGAQRVRADVALLLGQAHDGLEALPGERRSARSSAMYARRAPIAYAARASPSTIGVRVVSP